METPIKMDDLGAHPYIWGPTNQLEHHDPHSEDINGGGKGGGSPPARNCGHPQMNAVLS